MTEKWIELWDKSENTEIAIRADTIMAFREITGPHGGTYVTVEGLKNPVWVQESCAEIRRKLGIL